MMKRLSSQEIFIIISAVFVLIFMYATIIFSASINELTDMQDQATPNNVTEVKEMADSSSFVYLSSSTEEDYE